MIVVIHTEAADVIGAVFSAYLLTGVPHSGTLHGAQNVRQALKLVRSWVPRLLRIVLSQMLPDLAMVVLYGDLESHNVIPTRCDIALVPVLPRHTGEASDK